MVIEFKISGFWQSIFLNTPCYLVTKCPAKPTPFQTQPPTKSKLTMTEKRGESTWLNRFPWVTAASVFYPNFYQLMLSNFEGSHVSYAYGSTYILEVLYTVWRTCNVQTRKLNTKYRIYTDLLSVTISALSAQRSYQLPTSQRSLHFYPSLTSSA